MAWNDKQQGAVLCCRHASRRTAQQLERVLPSKTMGRLLRPCRRIEGHSTPGPLTRGQPTQSAGPYATIGEADGSVQTSFAMPSYNPNTTPVSLDYNSTTANPQPIFLTEYQLPTGQAVPSTITAQLTFDNTPLTTLTYSTSSLNPGDYMQIALQANATSLSTGRYPWSVTVTNGSTPTTYSGNVDIVNQASSPYGAGWALDNVEQLVSVTGGEMLVNIGATMIP